MTNNFENKNLHVANDEVEDLFILEGEKGCEFFLFNLGKGGNECFFFGPL